MAESRRARFAGCYATTNSSDYWLARAMELLRRGTEIGAVSPADYAAAVARQTELAAMPLVAGLEAGLCYEPGMNIWVDREAA